MDDAKCTEMCIGLLALAGMGMTMIITMSKLFRPIQKLGKFFKCSMCLGFWSGVFFGMVYNSDPFILGCIVSIVSYTWKMLMTYFINKYD
jgi:hypothetical protein